MTLNRDKQDSEVWDAVHDATKATGGPVHLDLAYSFAIEQARFGEKQPKFDERAREFAEAGRIRKGPNKTYEA